MKKYLSLFGVLILIVLGISFTVFFVQVYLNVHTTPPADPYIPLPQTPRNEKVVAGFLESKIKNSSFFESYFKNALKDKNVKEVEILNISNPPEAAALLASGRVDFVIGEAVPLLIASEVSNGEPLVALDMAKSASTGTQSSLSDASRLLIMSPRIRQDIRDALPDIFVKLPDSTEGREILSLLDVNAASLLSPADPRLIEVARMGADLEEEIMRQK